MAAGRFKRSVRLVMAGSLLFGGPLAASVIGVALPASASGVAKTIRVGNDPIGVSSDGTHVRVTNSNDKHGERAERIDGPRGPDHPCGRRSRCRLLGRHRRLGDEQRKTVTELDASTSSVVQPITVGHDPYDISSDGTHPWVTNSNNNTVTEITIQGAPPTITYFSPASGQVGSVVTIKGTNLSDVTKVTFNGVKGTVTKDKATQIKVEVPSGAKTGKILVVTPSGNVKTATALKVT
jgi:DNA-binding beta-propeller fold protein YncE